MGFQTVEALLSFVQTEERHVNPDEVIGDLQIKSIRCGDPLLGDSAPDQAAIVGGAVKAHRDGWLDRFIQARRGGGGLLEGHLNCGWMFSQGLTTLEQQREAIKALRAFVEEQNERCGTSFIVPEPAEEGSALPFMVG